MEEIRVGDHDDVELRDVCGHPLLDEHPFVLAQAVEGAECAVFAQHGGALAREVTLKPVFIGRPAAGVGGSGQVAAAAGVAGITPVALVQPGVHGLATAGAFTFLLQGVEVQMPGQVVLGGALGVQPEVPGGDGTALARRHAGRAAPQTGCAMQVGTCVERFAVDAAGPGLTAVPVADS